MSVNNNGVLSGTITNIDSANLAATTFTNPISSIINSGHIALNSSSIMPASTLTIDGEDADLVINGKSLVATLSRIEERLDIVTFNEKLEQQWDELRVLGDQYRELENRLKEMNKVWDILSTD